MSAPRYTPVFAASAFAQVKPTDSATEFSAIQAAINAIDRWETQLASMQIGPATSRNILVDTSTVVNTGNAIVIMLPANPAIGDPPCRIALLANSYSTGATGNSPVYIQGDTGNGDKIHASTTLLPRLYNAGAYISLIWVGGALGWEVIERDIGVYLASHASIAGPNGAAAEEFAFDGFSIITGIAGGSFTVQLKNLPNTLGDSCRIAIGSTAGTQINVGRTGGLDTINGAASPVAVTVADTSKTIICIAPTIFEMV